MQLTFAERMKEQNICNYQEHVWTAFHFIERNAAETLLIFETEYKRARTYTIMNLQHYSDDSAY